MQSGLRGADGASVAGRAEVVCLGDSVVARSGPTAILSPSKGRGWRSDVAINLRHEAPRANSAWHLRGVNYRAGEIY